MSLTDHGLTPRLRPLAARKSGVVSVLDVGTSKVVCIIAQFQPLEGAETGRGRTHAVRVIGIGHQRSHGLKGGAVVDLEAAEMAIRGAISAAERMAKIEIGSVLVNMTGGRIGSHHFDAHVAVPTGMVGASDVQRVLDLADGRDLRPGRALLHAFPTRFSLDGEPHIVDPAGLLGDRLGVELHVVTGEAAAARNLMLAVEHSHLGIEAVVATPYASGLSVLTEDEAEMGSVVIDMGAGTTSSGVFAGGHILHADAIAVGGHHVTMDLARGLTTRVSMAERLKTIEGSVAAGPCDERELITVPQAEDEDGRDVLAQVSRLQLVRIIRPRIEEILELVRDRLREAGFESQAGRRVVLTGGASQLGGLSDLAQRILGGQVRIGRPLGIKGLPDAAKSPAFSAALGLLVYPQVAHVEHFGTRGAGFFAGDGHDGYFSRVGRWIRESF